MTMGRGGMIRQWERFIGVDPLADKYPGWNPYNYTLNNPVLIIAPNGQWPKLPKIIKSAVASTVAFVAGAANAVASNMTGGFSGTRGDPNDGGEHAQAASYGQTAGDAVSIVIGLYEMTVSAVGVTGEVIAAPETGGVTAAAIPATAALGAHGTVTAASGLKNLISDDQVVYTKDKKRTATEHTSNARKSTKAKHEKSEARKAKEQKAGDAKYSKTKSTKVHKTNNQKKWENPNYYRKGPKY